MWDLFCKVVDNYGDIAVCSVSGDVWVVSGVDEKLENLKWRRYATGLFHPLGLRIIDDLQVTIGRRDRRPSLQGQALE